ncbi:MAG: calcium-binding protein [Paracoccaceae bacterium]|nr:calcium-binding protein [Paracoccaceae bacterium]
MYRRVFCVLAVVLLALNLPLQAAAQERRDASRVYVFGNSLVHHLGEEDHTNVPHWLDAMAEADGRRFAIDGQWGFLRNFADGLPPTANWSFPGVSGAWSPDSVGFGQAGFDAVIATPANFIQYQPPDAPYDGDNANRESPLGASLRLFDWVAANARDARLFVFEGWAELAGVSGTFPPSDEAFARFHAFTRAEYHAWYQELAAGIALARPGMAPRLIPVASVMAEFLAEGGPLAEIPAAALFTDDAPHGTPTAYFLAAMVTYAAIYEAPPPAGYTPPANLHPAVVENYAALRERIWQAVPPPVTRAVVETEEAPQTVEALPQRQPVALPPSGVRPTGIPALGMGLNGIADWSTQHPFIDVMKTARDWVGHLPGQWGGVTADELRAGGHLDENGWPISIPEGVERLESVLLTDQYDDAEHLRGEYVMFYDGEAEFELTGRARRVRPEPGQVSFRYTPGSGLVGIAISEIPAENPMRNIRVIRRDHLELHEAGVLFNPDWLERVQDLRVVRFMDWMMTNGSPQQTWADRPRMSDATWTSWGVPLEVMLALANHIGADPWFTLPHMADDDYARRFAEVVRDGLDPRLKAYVEYSNEVWNRIFPQAAWAAAEADALWGESDTGWLQFYGLRAAQMMDIWTEVFGDAADDRLVRVVSTHTGWPELEEAILIAPLALLTLGRPPQDSFDAYAVTGYFGYEMGSPEMADQMNTWLDQAEEVARLAGEAQGLRRVALREFIREARFEAAIAPVAIALQEGSLRELTQEVFPYHAAVASQAGLRLIMYEGGTHAAPNGSQVNDERLAEFFTAFNYTPEMAKLYEILLAGWVESGGTLFNAFVDVARASKWGSWGALRHLDDDNPRWDMLMAFNASGPNAWERREEAAFANGITRVRGAGGQRLEGTPHEDIMLGGPGNDILVSKGGMDHLHGGSGSDRVILPGSRSDYAFVQNGVRLVAEGRFGRITMAQVESLEFEAAPGHVVPVSGL